MPGDLGWAHGRHPDVHPQRRHHPARRSASAPTRSRARTASRRSCSALEAGYRLLDTAVNYGNETRGRRGDPPLRPPPRRGAGRQQAPRPPPRVRRRRSPRCAGRCERLGLDHLDLHLIHWPNPSVGQVRRGLAGAGRPAGARAWSARSASPTSPRRTSTGSSTTPASRPAVNQIELHPRFPQAEMRAVHERLGIRTEAWSPMGKRQAPLDEAAGGRGRRARTASPRARSSCAGTCSSGSLPIPKSATPSASAQNLDVFGFELTDDEVAAITALGRARRPPLRRRPGHPRGDVTGRWLPSPAC